MTVGIFSKSDAGHRREYTDFVKGLFDCEEISSQSLVSHRDPVFFLMIEDSFAQYMRVSLLRSLLGRKTVGLLFRPSPAAAALTWKLKIKHAALAFLKKLPAVKTLSIVPEFLDPKIERVIDGWIYDFQLWDISRDTLTKVKARDFFVHTLNDEVKNKVPAKPVLIALGGQNVAKGTRILADAMAKGLLDAWHVIAIGRFSTDVSDCPMVIEKAGGICITRFISDHELFAAYAMADAVWCHYDEHYDQASGILGRAVQFGVPVVVRPGSVSDRLCQHIEFPSMTLANVKEMAQTRESRFANTTAERSDFASTARDYSVRELAKALGCNPKPL